MTRDEPDEAGPLRTEPAPSRGPFPRGPQLAGSRPAPATRASAAPEPGGVFQERKTRLPLLPPSTRFLRQGPLAANETWGPSRVLASEPHSFRMSKALPSTKRRLCCPAAWSPPSPAREDSLKGQEPEREGHTLPTQGPSTARPPALAVCPRASVPPSLGLHPRKMEPGAFCTRTGARRHTPPIPSSLA